MFFNMGLAEIGVILLLGLLVFGPDRLPKAIKSLTSGVRSLRAVATDATRNLQDAAGWDNEDTRSTLRDLAELHPKRIMGSIVDDARTPPPAAGKRSGAQRAESEPALGSDLTDFDPDAP